MKDSLNEKAGIFLEDSRSDLVGKPDLSDQIIEVEKPCFLGENFCPLLAPTIFR